MEFGEKCGFYQTYLSRVENGHANPTLNAMEVIANALGLTLFELFDKIRPARAARKKNVALRSMSIELDPVPRAKIRKRAGKSC